MKDSAPSPRRLQYLRDYRRRKRSIRLWQVCLLAGLFALWELTTRLGLSDGFLTSSPSRMAGTCKACGTAGTCGGTSAPRVWRRWWLHRRNAAGNRHRRGHVVVGEAGPCAGPLSGGAERPAENGAGADLYRVDGGRDGGHHRHDAGHLPDRHHPDHVSGFYDHRPGEAAAHALSGARRSQMLWLLVFPANCPTLFNTLR